MDVDSATIDARPNGLLYVRGHLRITGTGGQLIREDTRVALCRCGHSENKPFCDGNHRRVGFPTTGQTHGAESK
jgi:CDGSH-type Zn-finger protein